MGQAESKEVAEDERFKELRKIAEDKGPMAVSKYLEENIHQWKKEKVTFAVTGRSATGKSTFINKIRDIKPRDRGYAKSGTGDTTKEPTPYQNPQNERIVFYDLPGVGTMDFPKETYVSKMKLEQYDYFFIFFDKVVSEDDCFLIIELTKIKKSFCLVRSKIDEDMRNAVEDERSEEEVIPAIRKQIDDQMSRFGRLQNSDAIFLISSRRKDIGDWPQLLCHIEKSLPAVKFETFMFSLPMLTENVIDTKYKTLKKRIRVASAGAASIAATPLPGLDVAANIAILVEEVSHYIEVFGLDKKTLCNLEGFDRSQLKSASFLVPGMDLAKVILSQLGKYVAILAAESAADLFLPIFGSIISAGTSAIFTYRYLSRTLDDFRDDACLVYKVILEKQRSKSENI